MKKQLTSLVLMASLAEAETVFQFSTYDGTSGDWYVVNDGVMGGLSQGNLTVDSDGNGVFIGEVSLENYGGFTSIRYRPKKLIDVGENKKIVVRLKGDGKNYQFRVKADKYDRHNYATTFTTSGEWQLVELDLSSMYPTFRGRTLEMPNFNSSHIDEIVFMIANKKTETFSLMIDSISLQK